MPERAPLSSPKVLRVVHGIQRTAAPSRSERTAVMLPRDLMKPLSAFELDYLNWYHGDPLKRSLTQAHKHSMNHRSELFNSDRCGCFHCGATFTSMAISLWVADAEDDTAFCPHCDIDAVLGDASGYPITPEFLLAMKRSWFGMG